MRALVIDPTKKIIKGVVFEPDQKLPFITIEKLVGGPYNTERKLENGDVVFSLRGAYVNSKTLAFSLTKDGHAIFGRAVILSYSSQMNDTFFVNCRSLIRVLKNEIVFHDRQETAKFRGMMRITTCSA